MVTTPDQHISLSENTPHKQFVAKGLYNYYKFLVPENDAVLYSIKLDPSNDFYCHTHSRTACYLRIENSLKTQLNASRAGGTVKCHHVRGKNIRPRYKRNLLRKRLRRNLKSLHNHTSDRSELGRYEIAR